VNYTLLGLILHSFIVLSTLQPKTNSLSEVNASEEIGLLKALIVEHSQPLFRSQILIKESPPPVPM
jgi:hypothetical protein